MPVTPRWDAGDHIVLRGILNGRVLSAEPYVVVRDTPELTALWLPSGTAWMNPTGREDVVNKRLNGDWTLFSDIWTGDGILRLTEPERPYSVLIFRAPDGHAVTGWYVNIEEPFRRTDLGFDYLGQLLDVVFPADRKTWRWKDKDEFQEAVALGLIGQERAAALRGAAEEAIESVSAARAPYTDEWMTWRPDPEWRFPTLPTAWDHVQSFGA